MIPLLLNWWSYLFSSLNSITHKYEVFNYKEIKKLGAVYKKICYTIGYKERVFYYFLEVYLRLERGINIMKVSEYIVEFLIEKGITDVFGYPGGMVTYLMDSFDKHSDKITLHTNYHEQASAFAACGYAQSSIRTGVCYATSGPGATNLITGICNAFFDSISTLFITGQVNTYENKNGLKVRQKGFQETDIVTMVKDVTKFSCCVDEVSKISFLLEKAYFLSSEGRPGPVLLDIPMDIFKSEVKIDNLVHYKPPILVQAENEELMNQIIMLMKCSKRPCILAGAGIKQSNTETKFRNIVDKLRIPVVTSMPGIGVLPYGSNYNYGFIGAYGNRWGNFILAKSDLVIGLGTRLDLRQIGAIPEDFAVNAKLIRVDIDVMELENKLKENELQINMNLVDFFEKLDHKIKKLTFSSELWKKVCDELKEGLLKVDNNKPNQLVEKIGKTIPDDAVITTDVGQNQVWAAQSLRLSNNQKLLFSSGHGAMGYSLPAAIGAYYAIRKPVVCFCGDGGFQMNIQELQFLVRENLPITIVLLNNSSLGMIRHFQEMYFEGNYTQTTEEHGYTTPNFEKIALAYGLEYKKVILECDIQQGMCKGERPKLIEVVLENHTYIYPKLEYGKPNQDQSPFIDRKLYEKLMEL